MSDQLADALRLAANKLTKPGDRRFVLSLLAQRESGKRLTAKQMKWAKKMIARANAAPRIEQGRTDPIAPKVAPPKAAPAKVSPAKKWIPILIGLLILLMIWGLATDKAVKHSPEQIGSVIGGMVGLVWAGWAFWGSRTYRGSGHGEAMYILILICGGIGWGIGWLVSRFLILH